MHIKQPVVQVCDTNCCACKANVRMAAVIAEFSLCNHFQRSGKDKKNICPHHLSSPKQKLQRLSVHAARPEAESVFSAWHNDQIEGYLRPESDQP